MYVSSHMMTYISSPLDCRAYAGLRTHLPEALRNGTFDNCLRVSFAPNSSPVSYQQLLQLHQIDSCN
jgi:hypothetical protein